MTGSHAVLPAQENDEDKVFTGVLVSSGKTKREAGEQVAQQDRGKASALTVELAEVIGRHEAHKLDLLVQIRRAVILLLCLTIAFQPWGASPGAVFLKFCLVFGAGLISTWPPFPAVRADGDDKAR